MRPLGLSLIFTACAMLLSSCDLSPVAWSPDGRRIAFTVMEGEGEEGSFSLWIADLEDGSQRKTADGKWVISAPSWSPDGRLIAYVRADTQEDVQTAGLYLVNASTLETKRCVSFPLAANEAPVWLMPYQPRWSPESDSVLFHSVSRDAEGEEVPSVVQIDVPSGEVKTLVEGGFAPGWSPDGSRIGCVLGDDSDGPEGIGILNTATGELRRIAAAEFEFYEWPLHCTWSPDGRALFLFTEGKEKRERVLSRVDVTSGKLEALHCATVGEHEVRGNIISPSPDGKQLAFCPGGARSVSILNLRDRSIRNLPTAAPDVWSPTWSPDGKWIAAKALVGDTSWVVLFPRDGSEVRLVLVTPGQAADVARLGLFLYAESIEQPGAEKADVRPYDRGREAYQDLMARWPESEPARNIREEFPHYPGRALVAALVYRDLAERAREAEKDQAETERAEKLAREWFEKAVDESESRDPAQIEKEISRLREL